MVLIATDPTKDRGGCVARTEAAGNKGSVAQNRFPTREGGEGIAWQDFIEKVVENITTERSPWQFVLRSVVEPSVETVDLGLTITRQVVCHAEAGCNLILEVKLDAREPFSKAGNVLALGSNPEIKRQPLGRLPLVLEEDSEVIATNVTLSFEDS